MLDRAEVENKTLTKITSKEREEKRLWNPIALREAIINAMVHNDYTYEVAPKFEFFDDRLEITSYGGLPEGITQEEFFKELSIPRNKELMRIFRYMELVEQLGSGVPRILKSYGKECFLFSENFIRMTFPVSGKTVGKTVVDVLELIRNNPMITLETLAEELLLSVRGVEYHIKRLKDEKIIVRKGGRKEGYWEITEDKNPANK